MRNAKQKATYAHRTCFSVDWFQSSLLEHSRLNKFRLTPRTLLRTITPAPHQLQYHLTLESESARLTIQTNWTPFTFYDIVRVCKEWETLTLADLIQWGAPL